MDTNKIGVLSKIGKILSKASKWRKKAIKIKRIIKINGNLLKVIATFIKISIYFYCPSREIMII